MHRGNPTLSGVTTAEISKNPKLRWKYRTTGPVVGSAAIVQGKVFIGSGDSNVVALALGDGKKLWSFLASGSVESTPLVYDGRIYFGDDNTNFYCLNANSGALEWKQGGDGEFKGGANLILGGDGKTASVIAGSWDNRLYSWNSRTGASNWVYETGNRINGAPAVDNGITVFGGCDALIHVLNATDGVQKKEVEAGAYIAASAALVDGRAYVGHYENEFICVDLAQSKVAWRYKDRNFPYMSSPAVTAQRVLVGGRDKKLHCIHREDGKPVWTFSTKGKVESSPVVAGDKVIVGSDDGRVYLVDLGSGEQLWSYDTGSPVESSPAVVNGAFVIGSTDGIVYCFGN